MILSLIESSNISSFARALLYKAIELYVARLGPESLGILDVVSHEPTLKRRVIRALAESEAALRRLGKSHSLDSSIVDKLRHQLA